MKIRHYVTLVIVLALSVSMPTVEAFADKDYPADKRIKLLRYDPNDVYTIYTLYGYQTNIEFGRNERIRTISVGSRSLWQLVPSGNRIFIRPLDDNITTNMTIITNTRTYQFDLKSGAGELSENPKMIYVARFDYPAKKKKAMTRAAPPVPAPQLYKPAPAIPAPVAVKPMVLLPPAAPIKTVKLTQYDAPKSGYVAPKTVELAGDVPLAPEPPSALNYNYTYTGEDALAPIQLYDDGTRTYMRLPNVKSAMKKDLMPALFTLSGKTPTLVDYQLEGDLLVLESVHSQMMLDYGFGSDVQVRVYNEELLAGM